MTAPCPYCGSTAECDMVDIGVGETQCIRDTRVFVQIVLDALAEGLTPEQIIDHYPQLTLEDIRQVVDSKAPMR